MSEAEDASEGRRLLSAVERIIEDPEAIIEMVDGFDATGGDVERRTTIAGLIVDKYARSSAITGGAAALPALVPGVGTLAALAGGTLVDMGLVLKFEVEMMLALTWLYGFDIRKDEERKIALLLASVGTYNEKSGRNFLADLAEAEGTAIWNYAPREVSKMLVSVMTKLALVSLGRGFARAIPLVGVVVGSSMNKVLTGRVGKRCCEELERRRRIADMDSADEDVVDAKVRDREET